MRADTLAYTEWDATPFQGVCARWVGHAVLVLKKFIIVYTTNK